MLRFLLLTLLTTSVSAQSLIIAHFDPFDGAKSNNSETVAKMVAKGLLKKGIKVKLCGLQTSFEKGYQQFNNCLKSSGPQDLIIGLGETGCKLKAEFVGRNLDKTYGPDNLGVERHNSEIIKGASPHLSLRYPLPQMYCALSKDERSKINLSNNAGSFVCNNVAYQMRYHHPEKMIGFIHVPSHFCKGIEQSNIENALILEKMISAGMSTQNNGIYLPHHTNSEEMPLNKNEIRNAAKSVEDKCHQDFYKTLKGVDQRGIWPFSN